jgi:hypothetical protein
MQVFTLTKRKHYEAQGNAAQAQPYADELAQRYPQATAGR